MKFKRKFLAIIGSQRKDGNSYLVVKTIFEATKNDYEIIQLAEKEIKSCNFCGKCEFEECPLEDDFNQILGKMKKADGIIFSFPRYFFLPSKFSSFIERLVTPHHFKKYHGYKEIRPDPTIAPPFKGKPSCLFVVSGSGWMGKELLKLVAYELKRIGMKIIDEVALKGDEKGDVLEDKKGIIKCKKSIKKLIYL